jgi:hypothetical protein
VRSVARRSGGIFWIEHAPRHAPHSSLLPSSPIPFTLPGLRRWIIYSHEARRQDSGRKGFFPSCDGLLSSVVKNSLTLLSSPDEGWWAVKVE